MHGFRRAGAPPWRLGQAPRPVGRRFGNSPWVLDRRRMNSVGGWAAKRPHMAPARPKFFPRSSPWKTAQARQPIFATRLTVRRDFPRRHHRQHVLQYVVTSRVLCRPHIAGDFARRPTACRLMQKGGPQLLNGWRCDIALSARCVRVHVFLRHRRNLRSRAWPSIA